MMSAKDVAVNYPRLPPTAFEAGASSFLARHTLSVPEGADTLAHDSTGLLW